MPIHSCSFQPAHFGGLWWACQESFLMLESTDRGGSRTASPSAPMLLWLEYKGRFPNIFLLLGHCSHRATFALGGRRKGARQASLLPPAPWAKAAWKPLQHPRKGRKGWQELVYYTAKVLAVVSSCSGERMEIKHIRKSWQRQVGQMSGETMGEGGQRMLYVWGKSIKKVTIKDILLWQLLCMLSALSHLSSLFVNSSEEELPLAMCL